MRMFCRYFSGTTFSSFLFHFFNFFPGARPVRLETRKICVSTAMVGSPKATFSTTLAVLRPTPAGLQRLAVPGTSAAMLLDQNLGLAMTFLALRDKARWS